MGIAERAIAIDLAAAGTIFTRALPFVAFGGKRQMPRWLEELGDALPPAPSLPFLPSTASRTWTSSQARMGHQSFWRQRRS